MDIDTALEKLRHLARYVLEEIDKGEVHISPDTVYDLAQTAQDIDGWLTRGGYHPRDWTPADIEPVPAPATGDGS